MPMPKKLCRDITIDQEIELTGRVGEAHWHAAKIIQFEADMKKAGAMQDSVINHNLDLMIKKLKELEGAQQLARIADDIGDAFANAFEKAIFDAEKLSDVVNGLLRDIAKSVMRNLVTQPLGLAISGAVGAIYRSGLYQMHAGETVVSASGLNVIMNNNSGVPLKATESAFDGERVVIEIETAMYDRAERGAGPWADRWCCWPSN